MDLSTLVHYRMNGVTVIRTTHEAELRTLALGIFFQHPSKPGLGRIAFKSYGLHNRWPAIWNWTADPCCSVAPLRPEHKNLSMVTKNPLLQVSTIIETHAKQAQQLAARSVPQINSKKRLGFPVQSQAFDNLWWWLHVPWESHQATENRYSTFGR